MAPNTSSSPSERVYRLDRFVVPESACGEFLSRLQETHTLLRTQPGFIQDFVLEEQAGPDSLNIATFVEWESVAVIAGARDAVKSLHERTNFRPQDMYAQLNIRADIGTYKQVSFL